MNEKTAEHVAEVLIHTILVLVVDDQWTSCLLVAPVSDKAFDESESAMFTLHLLFTIGQGCSYPPEHQLQAQ